MGKGALPFSFSRNEVGMVRSLARAIGAEDGGVVLAEQVHGDGVARVGECGPGEEKIIDGVDSLLTDTRGILLAIRSADCLPIFLAHVNGEAVGLVHVGRDGTRKWITEKAVKIMTDSYKLTPSNIIAVIGPSIGPCCYEVDLWKENERQLKSAGIELIFNCCICTACNSEEFSSYRKEGRKAGLMVSFIGLMYNGESA